MENYQDESTCQNFSRLSIQFNTISEKNYRNELIFKKNEIELTVSIRCLTLNCRRLTQSNVAQQNIQTDKIKVKLKTNHLCEREGKRVLQVSMEGQISNGSH